MTRQNPGRRGWALVVVLTLAGGLVTLPPAPAGAQTEAKAEERRSLGEMRSFVLQKLEYDREYFQKVLRLSRKGTPISGMSPDQFKKEVRRAKLNMPVLERFFKEREGYLKGAPLTLPGDYSTHREYTNLLAILNMFQAWEKDAPGRVLSFGKKVQITGPESLGRTVGRDARYYVSLYREYFFLMASANFRLGHDDEATTWFARLQADTNLQSLKEQLADEQTEGDKKARRLEELAKLPVAVMPFENIEGKEDVGWLSLGLMEVLSADLTRYTDLQVVERFQLDKLLAELELSSLGITKSRPAAEVGALLGVDSVVMGTFQRKSSGLFLTLKIVDVKDSRALVSVTGQAEEETLFEDARGLMLQLLQDAYWVDALTRSEIQAAHAPKPNVVRDLLRARLALATKSDEARELYEKAMKEDPAYAKVFADLGERFADVSATVAVMPFVNVVGDPGDEWMVDGVLQALTSDLPKMRFSVVERARLDLLLAEQEAERLVAPEAAREVGGKVGADFSVLGSVLHQEGQLRIDLRFVEIRTGLVLFSSTVEGRDDDFMGALSRLSREIARQLNEPLSEELLASLSGEKMSLEDFKKYVEKQLAKDALERGRLEQDHAAALAADAPPPPPNYLKRTRLSLYGSGAAVVGSAALLLGASHQYAAASEAATSRNLASTMGLYEHYDSQARSLESNGDLLLGTGLGLGAVAVGLAGYAVYNVFAHEKLGEGEDAPVVVPTAAVTPDGAMVGLSVALP